MNSEDKQAWPDLAGRALGGSVIYANDELFAERENLIKPEEPVFRPHTFGHKGQIMDGWETRRRREPGSDAAIVRLGCGGVVRKVVVDTSYFTGNYPPEVSVEACGAEGYPSPAELAEASWTTLVPRSAVAGDARNEFEVEPGRRATHVRLTMFPDGGVARLRVTGKPTTQARAALAERFLRVLPEPQLAGLLRAAGLPADEAARRAGARTGLGALAALDGLPATTRELFHLQLSI